jgi:hypothetical protein
MVELNPSASRKRGAPPHVIQITNIQQIMFSGYFEGFIMNRYGSYDVPGSAFKYIYTMIWEMHVVIG